MAQEVPYLTWIRATQRHLTPLQAATCPDSRARTVPSNLSEPYPLPRPLRSIIGASAGLGALSSSTYERIAGFSISPAAWMKARRVPGAIVAGQRPRTANGGALRKPAGVLHVRRGCGPAAGRHVHPDARMQSTLLLSRMGASKSTAANSSPAHSSIHNHFNQERHLYNRENFKLNRSAALAEWRQLAA